MVFEESDARQQQAMDQQEQRCDATRDVDMDAAAGTGTIAVPESVVFLTRHWRKARANFERRQQRSSLELAAGLRDGEPTALRSTESEDLDGDSDSFALSFRKEEVAMRSPRVLNWATGGYLATLRRSPQLFCTINLDSELGMAQQRLALVMLLLQRPPIADSAKGSPTIAFIAATPVAAVHSTEEMFGIQCIASSGDSSDMSAEAGMAVGRMAVGKMAGSPAQSSDSSDGSEC